MTVLQEYKALKKKSILLYILGWFAFLLPVTIIIAIKWEEYFVTNPAKESVTVGCILEIIVLAFAIIKGANANAKVDRGQHKQVNVYIALAISWGVVALILTLLESILADLTTILWYELIGIIVGATLFTFSKYYKDKKDRIAKISEEENIKYRLSKER